MSVIILKFIYLLGRLMIALLAAILWNGINAAFKFCTFRFEWDIFLSRINPFGNEDGFWSSALILLVILVPIFLISTLKKTTWIKNIMIPALISAYIIYVVSFPIGTSRPVFDCDSELLFYLKAIPYYLCFYYTYFGAKKILNFDDDSNLKNENN